MKKPQTPASGDTTAGEKVGGRKRSGARAEGDTIVNVQAPAAAEGDEPSDEEEEEEEEGAEAEAEKPKADGAKPATSATAALSREQILQEERDRVAAIRAMSSVGLEPTIDALIASGASVPDATRAIEAARATFRAGRMNTLRGSRGGAEDQVDETEEVVTDAGSGTSASLSGSALAAWKKDARLRANFNGDQKSYAKYLAACESGRVPSVVGRS